MFAQIEARRAKVEARQAAIDRGEMQVADPRAAREAQLEAERQAKLGKNKKK